MSADEIRERLANDEGLLDALDDTQAERALAWAEKMIALGMSEESGERLITMLRRINSAVERGRSFDALLGALESALPDSDAA